MWIIQEVKTFSTERRETVEKVFETAGCKKAYLENFTLFVCPFGTYILQKKD